MTDPGGPEAAVRDAGAALSALAQALYAVENGSDLVFVRSQAEGGGIGAEAAGAIVDELTQLWAEYPAAAAAVEDLEQAVAGRDEAEIARLLGPDGMERPDGSKASLEALLTTLRRRADDVAQASSRLATTAREAVVRLDGAGRAVADLAQRAAAVDAAGDPELETAQATYAAAAAALAGDPAGAAPIAEVERAVERARQRVEYLERQRRDLPAALDAAAGELAEIRRLVREGAEALSQTRSRVAGASGLLEALVPAELDNGERALGPWLDRIVEEADSGHWQPAAAGLERWRKVADAWLANARRVAAANAAPVRRRNELRGLLDAYRAKAVARGGVEDEALATLHQAAHDSLYNGPCDLAAAEAAVRRYVDAVNAVSGAGR